MKYTLIFLTLSLFLTACSRQDTKLTKQITGTWTRHGTGNQAVFVYAPNGSFSITETYADTPGRTNLCAGTWRIQDRVLIMTFTTVPEQCRAHVGTVARYQISHLDGHQLLTDEEFHLSR